MQDTIDKDFKKLVDLVKKHDGTRHNHTSTDGSVCETNRKQTITMFGHTFTMSELDTVSRFASQLEVAANPLLEQRHILDGAIFMVKVINKEVQVSFGGICKK